MKLIGSLWEPSASQKALTFQIICDTIIEAYWREQVLINTIELQPEAPTNCSITARNDNILHYLKFLLQW